MTCPTCEGKKQILGIIPPTKVNCPDCAAFGTIDADGEQLRAGKILKETRAAEGLSLRDYCLKYNIDPVIRSKQERGISA